jgi:hypothetical protein
VKLHLGSSLKYIFLAAVVLVAGSALASSKGSLELQHPTSVAGKQLASGNYTVRWEGTGDQVELKIYQGKNVVLSTPARVVKVENPATMDSAVVVANSDKTFSLSEIRFGGKKFALAITSDAAGAAAGAGASGN